MITKLGYFHVVLIHNTHLVLIFFLTKTLFVGPSFWCHIKPNFSFFLSRHHTVPQALSVFGYPLSWARSSHASGYMAGLASQLTLLKLLPPSYMLFLNCSPPCCNTIADSITETFPTLIDPNKHSLLLALLAILPSLAIAMLQPRVISSLSLYRKTLHGPLYK